MKKGLRQFGITNIVGIDGLNQRPDEDKQNDGAEYFSVSPMTIRVQLVNHGRIGLEEAPDLYDRDDALMDAQRIA